MLDVTLKVPLALLLLRRLFKGDDAGTPGIKVFSEALDRTPFTRGIPAFKQNYNFLPCLAHPVLHFKQFNLQCHLLFLVFFPTEFLLVRVGLIA